MVPVPESTFFPPLEKCLSGDELVIPWKAVFQLLSLDETSIQGQSKLRSFLSEPYVLQLLAKPFDAFAKATTQTKSDFETKTAAINVTPTTDGKYNIGEIKEDSLWLSKEADIDEISALRIVVEEWQTRSASRLLCSFTYEEASTLQAAMGDASDVQLNSTSKVLLSGAGSLGTDPETFGTQESRRLRILSTYLSERTYILRCAEILVQRCIYSEHIVRQGLAPTKVDETPWVETVAKDLGESMHLSGREAHRFSVDCIKGLRACIERLLQGSGWFKQEGGREDVELEFIRTQIAEAIHILELIFQAIDTSGCIPSATTVLQWYQLLSEYGYLDQYQAPHPSLQLMVAQLQSLTSVVSLAMLDLSRSLAYLLEPQEFALPEPNDEEKIPYITSVKTMNELHDILMAAANNATATVGPAVFVWGILLQTMQEISTNRREARELRQSQRAVEGFEREGSGNRRSSVSSEASLDAGIYEEVLENIMDWDEDGSPIEYLARSAVDGSRLFDVLPILAIHFGTASKTSRLAVIGARMRLIILDVVRSSIASLHYIPEVLFATLAAITGGQQYWDLVEAPQFSPADDPIAVFVQDDYLTESLLHSAISRYPYEQLPFLKLIRAISACSSVVDDEGVPIAFSVLEKLPTFTFELPADFRDYTTAQEEDNTNTIRLTRSLHLLEDRSSTKVHLQNSLVQLGADDFQIPAGTLGRVVSDPDKGKVTIWFHEYSGLRYFGKLLETALTGASTVDATTGEPVDRECAAEIIGTFATLLLSASRTGGNGDLTANSRAVAHRLLEEASDGLSRNRDIVSVIFDIFEEELQRKSVETGSEEALELLVACMQFIHAVLPILPGRVWPLLSRSSLLDMDGRGAKLSGIIYSTEIISGQYEFLTTCTRLFKALVEESVVHAAIRKIGRQPSSRKTTSEEFGAGVPNQVLAKVLESFTRTFLDVLQAMPHWRFVMPEQRLLLVGLIASTFEYILRYVYSNDDSEDLEAKITGTLAPSARHLTTSFLSNQDMTFQPILRACLDGFCTPNSTVNLPILQLWVTQVKSVLNLSLILIKVATQQGHSSSQLGLRLFKISPLLARLYAANDSFQVVILELFEALVINASDGESEPPSLLGLLGSETSKQFLGMLRDLGQPLNHSTHSVAVWNLLAAVVSKRQQWFAIYLLTGSTPRESLKPGERKTSSPNEKPIFAAALDISCNIEHMPPRESLALLRFITLAQNFWPWAMSSLQKHNSFIKSISEYLSNTKSSVSSGNMVFASLFSSRLRLAAYISEIMAMYIYHCRQVGNSNPAKDLLPHIEYLTKHAVSVPLYNSSLQGNLKRNFEAKFTGCNLQNFKRTGLVRREYGREYFYDINLADNMLHNDQAWTGLKNDGLATELAKANVNLSLVDAEVALLNGWKYLAVELSNIAIKDQSLQKTLAKVVADCLKSNMRSQLPEAIFNDLIQTRANLALSLLQKLVQGGSTIPEVRGLLTIVWDAIHGLDSSYGTALAAGDAQYYRTLLKMLFLTLRVQPTSSEAADKASPANTTSKEEAAKIATSAAIVQLALDIVQRVVAEDFRVIVTAIHDGPANVSPEDIALVTAILQACLRIPGMEFCHSQIVHNMVLCETARVATTLFSWSDKLAADGDPIYGELSMLFLLELSSMPAMAEQLAIEGVLGQISTASLTTYMRRGKASPVAEGSGPQRCYNVWVRGILPLLLNLLHAVGASIAAEVALFLRQFPVLLEQSAQALEAPDANRTTSVRSRPILYNSASEANSVALITHILSIFRTSLIGINEIPEVTWDNAGVLEDVEFWLASRHLLRERIVPLGPKEVDMSRQKSNATDLGCQNRLEERVVVELLGIRDILAGSEEV